MDCHRCSHARREISRQIQQCERLKRLPHHQPRGLIGSIDAPRVLEHFRAPATRADSCLISRLQIRVRRQKPLRHIEQIQSFRQRCNHLAQARQHLAALELKSRQSSLAVNGRSRAATAHVAAAERGSHPPDLPRGHPKRAFARTANLASHAAAQSERSRGPAGKRPREICPTAGGCDSGVVSGWRSSRVEVARPHFESMTEFYS